MKPVRIIVGIFGILILLIFFLPLAASPTAIGAVLTSLPFGWWHFLKRNIPQLSYDPGLIATGVICTIGVLLLGNWFMGALFKPLQKPQASAESQRKWKWSWSLGVYAAIWILFLIAFGAAGVFRHTTWLLKSTEPWYEERLDSYTELRIADGTVQQLMIETDEDLGKTRRPILAERGYRGSRRPLCEDFDIILYGNGSNQVAGYMIIPRNPKLLAKGNFAAWTPESPGSILPLTKLQETISKMEAERPSKPEALK
jgi:hypothetical protein